MTPIKNSGGNRALVAYCYKDNFTDEERFSFNEEICEILRNIGGLNEKCTIDDPRTVAINLSSGAWSRSLKIGNCGGDLIVGVYFYTAPPAQEPDPDADPDADPDEEPEPAPSITSLVCDALRETFGGVYGASAFVIPDDITSYTLEVE